MHLIVFFCNILWNVIYRHLDVFERNFNIIKLFGLIGQSSALDFARLLAAQTRFNFSNKTNRKTKFQFSICFYILFIFISGQNSVLGGLALPGKMLTFIFQGFLFIIQRILQKYTCWVTFLEIIYLLSFCNNVLVKVA